jgi:hypothetical protein
MSLIFLELIQDPRGHRFGVLKGVPPRRIVADRLLWRVVPNRDPLAGGAADGPADEFLPDPKEFVAGTAAFDMHFSNLADGAATECQQNPN